jgi:multiple sugar transport system permease protein
VLFQSYLNSDGQLSGIAYYQVFLAEPVYLFRFWKSLLMCLFIVVGQLVVTVLGGFGFAKYNFPGKHILFTILMILMTLPVQVILIPNYILFDKLHMLDSWSALILPAAFSPLGTFITMQSFKAIPNEVIDAVKIYSS